MTVWKTCRKNNLFIMYSNSFSTPLKTGVAGFHTKKSKKEQL